MRALFETIPLSPGADLVLVYRARTADDLSEQSLTRSPHAEAPVSSISSAKTAAFYQQGALRRTVPNIARRDVYMRGPPALTAAVRSALLTAGLSATHLHEERFKLLI